MKNPKKNDINKSKSHKICKNLQIKLVFNTKSPYGPADERGWWRLSPNGRLVNLSTWRRRNSM